MESAEVAGGAPSSSRPHPGTAYSIVLALGIAGVTYTLVFALWFGEQLMLAAGGSDWRAAWVVGQIILAVLLALPAWIGRRLTILPRYRAVFTTWVLTAVFAICLIPAKFAAPTAAQIAAVLQIVGLSLFLGLLWVLRRRSGFTLRPSGAKLGQAIGAAALLVLPWAAWGALGSPLDTVLNLAAAMLFGLAAGQLLEYRLWPRLRSNAGKQGHPLLLGGLGAAVALIVMGSSFGVNGQQLIFLFLLPGLSWYMARIGLHRGSWVAVAALAGLVVVGPLVFVDPDELNLVLNLGTRDIGYYVRNATLLGALIGSALSLGALLLPHRETASPGHRATGLVIGLLTVAGLMLVYFFAGQPGWHGERLFVILANQPVVTAAAAIPDPVERRTFVYDILVHHADGTQADLRRTLDRLGIAYTPYYLVNALEVDGGPLVRFWLARRPEVDRVLVSPELRPLPEPQPPASGFNEPPVTPLWSQEIIHAPVVWSERGVTGKGIIIGQGDSGADGSHPELSEQYRGNQSGSWAGNEYNWYDPWYGTSAPVDLSGHGTHTLGTILGRTVGIAPGATWIACSNLPRNLANPPRYLDCMQFLLAPFPQEGNPLADGRPELGAHIFNNSWGCPEQEGCDPTALLTAARSLRAAGVFVVASAGNQGPDCNTIDTPLALYDEIFTVGAVDEDRSPALFSSRGPVTVDGSGRTKPDIAAPGVEILSAFPGGTYEYQDGTSMAGPHVAGVVALMWSANPGLIGNIDRTERILIETAQETTPSEQNGIPCGDSAAMPNNIVGYGLVDAQAAVERAITGE